jgi:ABC-type nitrate/sulfonate/bicarbonate transport system substrate-binding protein
MLDTVAKLSYKVPLTACWERHMPKTRSVQSWMRGEPESHALRELTREYDPPPWLCRVMLPAIMLVSTLLFSVHARALDTIYIAIPTKSIQHVLYPMAQEQHYFEPEGIDLKIVLVPPAVSIQALTTKSVHFTLAGTSALIARSRSNVPLKVIFAANRQVLQWVLTRPEITSAAQLKNKKIATPGIASSSTFMLKTALAKNGLNPDRDVVFLDPGAGNHLTALLAGTVDAAILGAEQRYVALAAGMREQFFLGREVKNSWGTLATSERIMQENPRQVAGVLKATLKALRLLRQSREIATSTMQKFARVDAVQSERVYDDLISTFTLDGTVDEETQRSDLVVIRDITRAAEPLSNKQAYDFSIVQAANRELNDSRWRP